MKAIARGLQVALFATAMTAAPMLAQTVTIDYDHTVNFLKLKTYSLQKLHATDPSVESRITIALKRNMENRYMAEVGSGGDVTVTAVEATQDKTEFISFYDGLSGFNWQGVAGAGGFLDAGTTVKDVPLDTVILDMYDTKTHQLLWRGAVTVPVATSEDKNDRNVDHAVTVLLSKYPPKYEKP